MISNSWACLVVFLCTLAGYDLVFSYVFLGDLTKYHKLGSLYTEIWEAEKFMTRPQPLGCQGSFASEIEPCCRRGFGRV